ncbi:hypothetical protein F2Q70_00021736 [Brassica cretica]|uniref:Uncharacterized protein n=1 Tax=Brassica cretica TaxID=69181 RepID=A0A8S9HEH0_BRACR|nr:hypothetical protein F2Q70_00021736 [Brassica cretica]KAF2556369.1 hypothetical protein F2Q68_00015425 [Brassica cretica]
MHSEAPSQPLETPTYNISEQSEEALEPMQVDQATAERTLRKRKEKVPKHLKRDPTVYYDLVRVVKQQTGYMEIGDNLGFIAVCRCNHETDEESEIGALIELNWRYR